MNAKTLIELLQKLPPEIEVRVCEDDNLADRITGVFVNTRRTVAWISNDPKPARDSKEEALNFDRLEFIGPNKD